MRTAAALSAAGLFFVFGAVAAAAGNAAWTIDSRSPPLEVRSDGGWTAALGLTNLTDAAITLSVKPKDASDTGCTLTTDRTSLPAAEHSAVTVTVPAGCKVGEDGIDFVVSAAPGTAQAVAFTVSAAPKPNATTPEWSALWAFPIGLVALFASAAIFFLVWRTGRASPREPLQYLESTWSFSDSWVSNVTVAGGVLTGIFGSSDVVTAILGKDAKSSIALATVGVAVAVAFIGAGPIVLLATKSTKGDFVTVGGLLAASAVTLTGAYGEIWVLYRSGRRLDLGHWENRVVVLAVLAAILLTFYSYRTLLATLRHGTTPHRLPPSDAIRAARMIVAALQAHGDIDADELDRAIARTTKAAAAEGPGGAMRAPGSPRSALL